MSDLASTSEKDGGLERAWPLFGYAPGDYMCKCVVCDQTFVGDKRAVNCLECAVRAANRKLASPAPAESGGPVAAIVRYLRTAR